MQTVACLHDFCSFSRGSAPARSTRWTALRSIFTCTLGAISTVSDLVAESEDPAVDARRHDHLIVLLEADEELLVLAAPLLLRPHRRK